MKDKYFYIEFEIANSERFNCLKVMFDRLKKVNNDWMRSVYGEIDKNELDYADPVDDFPWKNYLDNEAIEWFADTFDYETEEGKIYSQLWELTHYQYRTHPFMMTPGNWDFESMIDSIFHSEYDLIDLKKEEQNQGCLYYNPHGHPFGGSDSLCELIRSFGNTVIYDSWHENENSRIISQWNYELAKKLVDKGIGFTPDFLEN